MKATITQLNAAPFVKDPNHVAASYINRFASAGLPVHVAVHEVVGSAEGGDYCTAHSHEAEDEVNILLGEGLRYRIELDGETSVVEAPAVVFVPAGCMHAANVESGTGQFICLRFRSAAVEVAREREARATEAEAV